MRHIKFEYKAENNSFLKNVFNSLMDALLDMDINESTQWDADLMINTAYEVLEYGEKRGEM